MKIKESKAKSLQEYYLTALDILKKMISWTVHGALPYLTVPENEEKRREKMRRFFRNQTLSRKVLVVSSIIFFFSAASGLFSHLNSSNPRSSIEDLLNRRFRVYQTSAFVIKNVASVQSNLEKLTRWAQVGFDEREICLLGEEQLAVLDGANETIRKIVNEEWLTPEERNLHELTLKEFTEYRELCLSTITMATSDLQKATVLLGTTDGHFKKINRSLHDLLDVEARLCQESPKVPNRSFRTASGNLYPAASRCHGSVSADQPMSRQIHYRSCQ